MPSLGPTSSSPLFELLQSYGNNLKTWTTGIVIRYAIAVTLLLAAGAGLIAAIGVGMAALFHWIESIYGLNTAYAAVAGLLVCLSVVSAAAALWLLKRSLPSVPRPRRQKTKAAGGSLAADAMLSAFLPRRILLHADPATEVMIGLAAACLVGWLVTSRLDQSRNWTKAK